MQLKNNLRFLSVCLCMLNCLNKIIFWTINKMGNQRRRDGASSYNRFCQYYIILRAVNITRYCQFGYWHFQEQLCLREYKVDMVRPTQLVQRMLSGSFDVTVIIMMSKSKNTKTDSRIFDENRLVFILILQNEKTDNLNEVL